MNKIKIDQDICTGCGICINEFSCPSFIRIRNGKITVNEDLCNNNGSCIQVCPVNAIVRVKSS